MSKHSNSLLVFLGYLWLLFSCNPQEDRSQDTPPPLFSAPAYYPLNVDQGYSIHPIKGDSIKPLLKANGEPLITGKPLKLTGRVLPESEISRKMVPAGKPNVINIPQRRFCFEQEYQPLKTLNNGKLQSTPNTASNESAVAPAIISSKMPAQLVPVSSKVPIPIPAAAPGFKDGFSHHIRYLDVEQGMNSSRVQSLLQDKRGNLWFGTHGGGVTRYNGEYFSFYTTEHGLNGNIVKSMFEDSKGNIWFGTWVEGVSMFDGTSLFHLSDNDHLKDKVINAIAEDYTGTIWMVAMGSICRFENNQLQCFTNADGTPLNGTSITQGQDGRWWFGTLGQGILSYDGNDFTRYTKENGLISNDVNALLTDHEGDLWIGTNDQGLCKFDGRLFTHYKIGDDLKSPGISYLLEDSDNTIWMGTMVDGMFKFDGESFYQISREEGLSDNTINAAIIEDQNGQIWVGTSDGGTSVINKNSFTHLEALEQISGNHVRAIKQDPLGNYWLATWGAGVIYYDGNRLFQYTTDQGIPHNTVWDILIDKKGQVWFVSLSGLTMFDGQYFHNALPGVYIASVLMDKSENLWLGGTQGAGLLRYDGEHFEQFSTDQGFNESIIWSLTEDSKNNIWIATWGCGVVKYDGEHFTFYTEKEGLIGNDIWSVMEDRRGNLWFGSYGEGANVFDGSGFIYLNTNTGISNNIVNSIIEDKHGNVWLGTENGLNQLIIDQSQPLVTAMDEVQGEPPFSIKNYLRQDGLIAEDFNVHSAYRDNRDRMWWGTGKSLFTLDLSVPLKNHETHRTTLEQVQVGGRFVDFVNFSDSSFNNISYRTTAPFLNVPTDLLVPFAQNHLTFHFTANNYLSPHKNIYSYLVPGISDQWSPPSAEAKADYRNIPPGEHQFLISTLDHSMKWSEPYEYSFVVLPPWWQTWWARAVYLLLIIAGITGIIRWRTANIKQRQRELEKLVRDRTAEVVEQQKRSDELLLNILPANVAQELKETGKIEPVHFEEVSVLFADFKEFTNIVASIPSKKLINELNEIFQNFDDIVEQNGLEKIQTIGDAYVAACGLPNPDPNHARKCVEAAKGMIDYLTLRNEQSSIKWKVRVGIHSGPITAGVVGKKKFTYDVFGDTVNIAARIESVSDEGRINVSAYTHDLIKRHFQCEYRGKINAKGKGDLDMYFVSENRQ